MLSKKILYGRSGAGVSWAQGTPSALGGAGEPVSRAWLRAGRRERLAGPRRDHPPDPGRRPARILERYSPAELIGLAQRLDPGLTARDFAEARQRLDQIDDAAFARYGLGPDEVAVMRSRFAAWPSAAKSGHDRVQAVVLAYETSLISTLASPTGEQLGCLRPGGGHVGAALILPDAG